MNLNESDRQTFVRAVLDDLPSVEYSAQATTYVHGIMREQMPKKLQAVYDGKELRGFLNFDNWRDGFRIHVGTHLARILVCYPTKLTDADLAHLADLNTKAAQQQETYNDLRYKLTAVIKGCRTLKQAKERLPEFEKYLPKERDVRGGSCADLPMVANVVAELTKAGWPKDKGTKPQTKGTDKK